jgi:uncharacterized protein YndB with AHSA1/START domain
MEPVMLEVIAVLAVIIALAIAAILVLALTKPDTFRVQRSAVIRAPAEAIFPLIDDFHQWSLWSPYEGRDPEMKRSFTDAARGKGAVYAWDGNKDVGSGRMEILDSSAPSKIVIKLDFLKPFEAHNSAEFTLLPQDGRTDVTWATYGPAPFMSKLMQVFMNLDNMIGRDFEAGLAKLKTVVEK